MPKIDLLIPKGTKCKNGICEQDIEIENLEIPEINPTIKRIPEIQFKNMDNGHVESNNNNTVEKIIEKIIKVTPSYQPNYVCKGAKCKTLPNPNYTARVKGKCTNCNQFTKETFGTCIYCGSSEIEEISEDELNNLGIPTPADNIEDSQEAD
jgi:hypothetical protein